MTTILIVDDEHDTLLVMQMLLQLEGYAVHTASSGARALEIASTTDLDIVVTDWMMPAMDGLELCRRLRSSERTRDIPIILSSAAGDAPPGRGALYDAFLSKPTDFDTQLAAIQQLTATA